jgi:hypothetical protein
LAKTLPDDSYLRRPVSFAEQELASGDIKTALQFIVADNPDPSPWEDLYWIARTGRFDRAIELAKKKEVQPVGHLGGLLEVARRMLDQNDRSRAVKIVDDVERELPSITGDDSEYAGVLRNMVAEIRAGLGQTERAARLLGESGVGSVSALLAIATKYPAAASLREQAWREAERVEGSGIGSLIWQLLLDDAKSRDDKADISRVAQGASRSIDAIFNDDHVYPKIRLARALLEAGFPELAGRLAKQWTRWVEGEGAIRQFNNVSALIPLLVDLALDQDVQSAVNAVNDDANRIRCLSKAAQEYFRIGRDDLARQLGGLALRVAILSPIGEPKRQQAHDVALHDLALARADHGDIQGALDVTAQLRDEKRVREVTYWTVRRAIDHGYGPIAGPAIRALEQKAISAQDASLLLQTAMYWYEIKEEQDARRTLAQALKTAEERQSNLAASDSRVAELMWHINGHGEAQALLEIVDRLQVNNPGAIDHLVQIVSPLSPAVAVQLSSKQVSVESRILELANIAIQIAEAKK